MGRIPYWGCKSNLCGADLEGGGASNLTGADRGRMWIGAVRPASPDGRPADTAGSYAPRGVPCASGVVVGVARRRNFFSGCANC